MAKCSHAIGSRSCDSTIKPIAEIKKQCLLKPVGVQTLAQLSVLARRQHILVGTQLVAATACSVSAACHTSRTAAGKPLARVRRAQADVRIPAPRLILCRQHRQAICKTRARSEKGSRCCMLIPIMARNRVTLVAL